jgi:hypothetical protein
MRFNLLPCRSLGLLLVSGFACASVQAADYYVLPHGAGSHDGSSWENALDASASGLQKGWDAVQPGETLFVGGGEYAGVTLSVSSGGAEGKYKKLVGVTRGGERPRFVGKWTKEQPAKGADFMTIKQGVSYWSVENLDVRSYRNAVISSGGRHTGVRLINLDVTGARAGIEFVGGGLATDPALGTHDVLIQDCEFVNYTKRGIRFQGGNYNVKVVNCLADAGGESVGRRTLPDGLSGAGSANGGQKTDPGIARSRHYVHQLHRQKQLQRCGSGILERRRLLRRVDTL